MERGIVSVDGEARPIDTPFMVIATQNPVDFESTFPLPNAQLDRFLMRIAMGYPSKEDEATLLRSSKTHYDRMAIRPVISKTEIQELQVKAQSVFIDDSIYNYIHEIILATRVRPNIELGVSPRGALAFRSALQAAALVNGRNFVSPDDVQQYAVPCLAHRLRLASKVAGTYDWDASARVVSEILSELPAPHYRRS